MKCKSNPVFAIKLTKKKNQSIKDNHGCGITGKIWGSDSYLIYSCKVEGAFKVLSPKIQLQNDLLNLLYYKCLHNKHSSRCAY